ncbi:DUF4232 domain-containing protein [Actinoplanes sp. CA-030573]|uniref:DUF4232 domain-containing protein n=1 Tax=Actinoplanes sp. CA-030573 TaxID=3239898 RepID=UPI003D8D2233
MPRVVSVPPATIPACPPSGLRASAERGEAAAGYREMTVYLENCGDRDYQLQGRPDIVVLGADRNPLPVVVEPNRLVTAPPRRIVLKPGEKASSTLSWHSTVEAGKEVATGAYLAVAALAGTEHQTIALPSALDLGTTGKLATTAWN